MGFLRWLGLDKPVRIRAKEAVDEYTASEKFGNWLGVQIAPIVIDRIRSYPDDAGLSEMGFILKMAVEIFDAAKGAIDWDGAKDRANKAYRDHLKTNRIRFGMEGWDWSGRAARDLAHEYEMECW